MHQLDHSVREHDDCAMDGEDFQQHRPLLMGLAYRMLGSAAEAEDAVQDAWLRWRSVDSSEIVDARAWLSTTVVRLCIDRLKSARTRRETYPGVWLPDCVLTTTPLDVESIQLSFMVLLERLNPKERAVFLLHRVFDYSHAEIAKALTSVKLRAGSCCTARKSTSPQAGPDSRQTAKPTRAFCRRSSRPCPKVKSRRSPTSSRRTSFCMATTPGRSEALSFAQSRAA